MNNLSIEKATIGVDENNLQIALNNLNTRCVEDTITKMNSAMNELRSSVDSAWVGQSAETFKNNMEIDKDKVVKHLHKTYETLVSEFNQIKNAMNEADQNLVKARGNN